MTTTTLKPTLGTLHLWGIAVGLVISGEYFGWSYGWGVAGTLGFLVTTLMVAAMYSCFIFSFTELTTAIPHAGGPFAYAYRAFGPTGGFIAGFATLIEFVFAPPAIAMAIGAYLNVQFPSLDHKWVAAGAYLIFMTLNLVGIGIAAAFGFASICSVIVLGDESGYTVGEAQQTKLAAMEAMWETEPAPAAFNLIAIPNEAEMKNDFAIEIPWVMGLIGTRSLDKQIPGIKEIKAKNRERIVSGIEALKALDVINNGRLEFDAGWTDLASSLMAIRKTVTPGGRQFTYTAGRNEHTGHADLAWALFHALHNEPLEGQTAQNTGIMEIY